MNLIEELGIENCRAIVDGAPNGANEYSVWASLSYYKTVGERCELWKQHYKWWTPVLYNSYMKQHRRSLDDLRTSIANHDCDHDWEDISEVSATKRTLICTYCSSIKHEQLQSELNNCSVPDSSAISFEDCCADNFSHFTDICTDIRNHISPNTKVIEG